MATRSIQDDLNRIMAAIYGEEVRGSIHDAIETCYDDVQSGRTLAAAAADNANAKANLANSAATTANTAATNANNKADIAIAAASAAEDAATATNTAITAANAAASNANAKAALADEKATLADTKATLANTAAGTANSAAATATTKANLADDKATLATNAAATANTAASNADAKATLATTAADTANTAAANANTKATLAYQKATLADTAATTANTAASNADAKAALANTAAATANAKAALADEKATLADTKATLANTAATAANTAASNATTAAGTANTAAGTANTAASNADAKATLADAKATLAAEKAALANTAATTATAAAGTANTAAGNADNAATAANAAAVTANSAANTATSAASTATSAAATATSAAADADNAAEEVRSLIDQWSPDDELDGNSNNAVQNQAVVKGLDDKANAIIMDAESGNVVTIEDGADGVSVKSLIASINPIQDLRGYDKPWPAGTTINLLDETKFTENYYIAEDGTPTASSDSHYSAIVPVIAGETYTWSGIQYKESSNNKRVHAYVDGTWQEQIVLKQKTNGEFLIEFTIPAGANGVRISCDKNDYDVMIIHGSADLVSDYGWTDEAYIAADGTITSDNLAHYSDLISVTSGKTYTFYGNNTESSNTNYNKRVHGYLNGAWVQQIKTVAVSGSSSYANTFEVPSGVDAIRVSALISDTDNALIEGSSELNYIPHSNICPINGHTGCNIYDDPAFAGIVKWNQLCGIGASTSTISGVTYTNNGDGTWTITGTATATKRKELSNRAIPAGHVLYIRHGADVVGSSSTFYVCLSYNGGSLNSSSSLNGALYKATGNGFNEFSIRTFSGYQIPEGGITLTPQLFDLTEMFGEEKANEIYDMGSTDGIAYFKSLFPKNYYVYDVSNALKTVSEVNGDPCRHLYVDWADEAGTVYKGSINFTTGKLTLTHEVITFDGTETGWAKYSPDSCRMNAGHSKLSGLKGSSDCLCNLLKNGGNTYTPNSGEFSYRNTGTNPDNPCYLSFRLDGVTDQSGSSAWSSKLTDWAAENTPLTVMLELVTPEEIQLTPAQLKLLLGVNNVWVDCGSITEMQYACDTKMYIDNHAGEVKTIMVSGTDPVIVAEPNVRYVCGEVSTISFTPPSEGIVDLIFTSGSSIAVLTLPNTVKMPVGFSVVANTTYEINIMDGVYGVVASWV